MSRDAERVVELVAGLGHRLNDALGEVVPPDALVHLLNAQRELLTALFLIYEHQAGSRRRLARPPRSRSGAAPRQSRVTRIKVE